MAVREVEADAGLDVGDVLGPSSDIATRLRMQEWLIGLLAERRTATVLVTHDVEEALLLGHRLLRLSHRPATVLEEARPRPAGAERTGHALRSSLRPAQGRRPGSRPRCLR